MRKVGRPDLRIVEGGRWATRSEPKTRIEGRIWHPAAGRPRLLTLSVNHEADADDDQAETDHATGVTLDFSVWR
jgi:hypothetical protein